MNHNDDHFLTLCNLWCDQQLSADQIAELQTFLRSDVTRQRIFVEFVQLHGQLAWDAGVLAGAEFSEMSEVAQKDLEPTPIVREPGVSASIRRSRYTPGIFALAAAAMVLAGSATFYWRDTNVRPANVRAVPTEARTNSTITKALPKDPQSTDARQSLSHNSDSGPLKPLELHGMKVADTGPAIVANSPEVIRSDKNAAVSLPNNDLVIVSEIDRLIAAGWTENNIIPTETADDHEWVRRCFLTLTGRIPTVSEASAFVGSATPRKREALVDSLLEDPRFSESLAVTWTNLLIGRGNSRNVDADALYNFLKRQFLRNRSWMETVGNLIAAEGRSDQNGATNFLLAHLNDQATPATAVTARLFLGLQVQCTQCHDHPFAKERHQNEFWSLNAFFKQAQRRSLQVTDEDGKARNIWTLADSGSSGMTFYATLRGQEKATLPEFDGQAMTADDSRSRRAELVRLLAVDSRQMVAQAMINRTWAQVFGFGFTNPIDDLGPHNPVSHPELLRFLTQAFAESGYDVRRLMRWFMLSDTFHRSSFPLEQSLAVDDPEDGGIPLFSRAYPRPMAPEQVYDSIRIAIRSAAEQPTDSSIGSVHRREWVEQFVRSYGTDENDEQLTFEGNIAQALLMMNGPDLQTAIPLTAAEVTKAARQSPEAVRRSLERIAMATVNREPSEQEEKVFRGRYRVLSRSQSADQAIRTVTEDMLWAYLNSSEFTSLH